MNQEPAQALAQGQSASSGPPPNQGLVGPSPFQRQEPGGSTQSVYDRAEAWFTNRYLPTSVQDPYIVDLTRDILREYRQGIQPEQGLVGYKKEDQEEVLKHFAQFKAGYESAKSEPLRAATIFGETYNDDRLFKIASDPKGLEVLADLGLQSGDTEVAERAQDALNLRNIGTVSQVMNPGSRVATKNYSAVARAGMEWGGNIQMEHTKSLDRFAQSGPPGAGMAIRLGNEIAYDNEYQAFAWQFSQSLKYSAEAKGFEYTAANEPKNAVEARKIFEDAIPLVTKLTGINVNEQAVEAAFYGPIHARTAMAAYAHALYAARTADETGGSLDAVQDVEEILSAYAAGRVSGNPAAKAAMAAAYPAFWILDKIIAPLDRGTNALLFGNVGETAADRYKFADGTVFTNTLDAAEYSLKLIEAGGEYLAPQWLVDESAGSRFSALAQEDLMSASAQGRLSYGEMPQMAARGFTWLAAGVQEGARRIGDHFKGSELIPDEKAARPVVLYNLTVAPEDGLTDFSKVRASLFDGSAGFIGGEIRSRISTAADRDWGYRTIGWVTAEAPTVALSLWNFAHTNQVTRGAVNDAYYKAFGVERELVGSARAPVSYKFTDGKQMNAEWAAVREHAAEALGAGKKGDHGGSSDIADMLVTSIRDNPGQTYEEVLAIMRNDAGFLEQVTNNAKFSGLSETVNRRALGMSADEFSASQRLATAKLIDGTFTALAPAVRGATLAFGSKNFWTTASSRNSVMQARRGLYLGPVGVPIGPISARIIEGSEGIGKSLKASPLASAMNGVSALHRATAGIFGFSHVATGTPVPGLGNALPEVVRIPFRMKKTYERQYRQQAATLQARAQVATNSLFFDQATGDLLPIRDRRLLAFVAEGGATTASRTNYLIQNTDVINDYARRSDGAEWIKGATEQERRASAYEIAQRLDPWANRIKEEHQGILRSLEGLGIVESGDEVKNYLLHFFHGPAGDASGRWADDAAAKLTQTAPTTPGMPAIVDRGTSAIDRVGPVNLVEALRMGYFAPELDTMLLMHHRITQAAEVELKAYFTMRISKDFGVPMLRGKEAAVQLIQGVRGTGRWAAEMNYSRGIMSREAYLKDISDLSKLIRNKNANANVAAQADIAQELGISVSKFLDEKQMVKAMMESESFLMRASSGRKGDILSRIMPAKAREALRNTAREMLAHKTRMRALSLDLGDLGLNITTLKNLTDEELAAVSRSAAEARFGPIQAAQRRVREAEEAQAVIETEVRGFNKQVADREKQLASHLEERIEISERWNRFIEEAKASGLVVDDLGRAKNPSDVRGWGNDLDWVSNEQIARQRAAFNGYKKAQADYVENFRAQKDIRGSLEWLKGEQSRMAAVVEAGIRRIAGNKAAAAAHQARIRTMRTAAGARAADLRGEFNGVADAFLQSVREYTEVRRTMETLMESSTVRGVALALKKSAHATAAHGQAVRAAAAAFEMKHGISAVNARQRATAARSVPQMKKNLERKLLKDSTAQRPIAKHTKIEAIRRGPDKNGRPDVYAVGPVAHSRDDFGHLPAQNHAQFHEYHKAQEGLDALEMSREEQSAMLWAVFGARQITEVPLHEIRALVNSPDGMRASVIRFLQDPFPGKKVARTMSVEPGTAGHRFARALGVDTNATAETVVEGIEKALDEYIWQASKGSVRHQRVLDAIPVADLATIYRYEDLTTAAMEAVRADSDVRRWVGTLTERSRGSLERTLRTTFIPLEIGLAMKTLMGEKVFKHSEAMKISMATKFGEGLASVLERFMPVSRGFKAQAIAYRASLLPGRRNSLFDGVRSMIQLASWQAFSPSARKAFLEDISDRGGSIVTATGTVDRRTVHAVWEARGSSSIGAQADDLENISRSMNNAVKKNQAKRTIKEIKEVGEESRRTSGVNIPKGALVSAAAGGTLAEALFDDLATGAAMGFGLYGFTTALTGTRRTVHSSGRIATKAEMALPVGPHAIERADNTFRYFQYWTYVKSGMAPMDAMDMMLPRMRDYTNLTDAERRIITNVSLLTPFMFYNFTKQNTISQVVRWMDRPDITPQMLRTISSMGDDENLTPDSRIFWQSVTDSIKRGGTVWNMQDETTAVLNLLAPVTGFIEGLGEGQAVSGLSQGLKKLHGSGDPSPIWQAITEGFKDEALPPDLARKILDEYGAFSTAGAKGYWNEEGVARVEIKGYLRGLMGITGVTMGINDIGRLHTHTELNRTNFAILEALGLGRFYEKQLAGEMDMSRATFAEQEAVRISDVLDASGITGETALNAANLDFYSKAVVDAMISYKDGKNVADTIRDLRIKITAIRGKSNKAVAGRLPQYQRQ